MRVFLQQAIGPHDHAGRAIAALQAVHLAEALLQGVQRAVRRGDALDGHDAGLVGLHGEYGAGLHRTAVEVDGACAAMAGLAADMQAGQPELLAQEMNEQGARLDRGLDRAAVDLHGDALFCNGLGECAVLDGHGMLLGLACLRGGANVSLHARRRA